MKTARSFNMLTGDLSAGEISALDHKIALDRDPQAGKGLVFFEPKSGDPLRYIPGGTYERLGKERYARPHFQRAIGYGLEHPDRAVGQKQGFAMFPKGTKTLLTLDGITHAFSYKARDIDFSGVGSKHCLDVPTWIARNRGNFRSAPIDSAQSAILALRAAYAAAAGNADLFRHATFATYNSGVAPYGHFFLGWNNADQAAQSGRVLAQIYANLSRGREGALVTREEGQMTQPNRAVGLPILLHFVPCKTTLFDRGSDGLKGNHVRDASQSRLYVELFATPEQKQTEAYEKLRRLIVDSGGRGVYVLGAPSVSYDPALVGKNPVDGQGEFHQIRITLNDIGRQIYPVGAASGVVPAVA